MKLRHMTQMRANSAWEQLGRPEAETGEAPSTVYRRLRREMLRTPAVGVRRAARRRARSTTRCCAG